MLEALDTAQRVMAELESNQLSLHFWVDETTNHIRAELKDAEGSVVRRMAAFQALELLSGNR